MNSREAHIATLDRLQSIRNDFPILSKVINGQPLVYLDNGATAQKPIAVIDTISDYYKNTNANVHRGVHQLSQDATSAFESSRSKTAAFIHASDNEIVFTKGTTDGINLLASSLGELLLKEGDEIVTTQLEHHSNFVPWQLLCEKKKANFKVVPLNDKGELDLDEFKAHLSDRTKIVAVSHASNTLGTVNDIPAIAKMAHEVGAVLVVDGAQYAPHHRVDVKTLNCDFYVFSGHKLFGPTGIGVLFGKAELLQKLPPYQTGGGMISEVGLSETSWAEVPQIFEAGTPHIAGAVGLEAAMNYMDELGFDFIENHEKDLLDYASEKLNQIPELDIYGPEQNKVSLISFNVKGQHPFDVGSILDQMGIAVRTGHHCTQPIMERYQIPGTVRVSFAFYNTLEEVDRLVDGLHKTIKMLS